MNDDETPKKKSDKTAADNITVSLDKSDVKKSDTEEPKPRIVLTFRSEKSNTKSANMKIVSPEEKQEEVSPRRSGRTRGKWDWVCDSDTSISPKKDRSQPVSENDESDSSHTAPKRTRRRSKDDNIIAHAIARKEKSYNEATPGPTQRLSRRLKPTAKILANEELRLGLESQNNARLGISTDKSPEEGVRTRRSAKPASEPEKPKAVQKVVEPEVVELDSDSQNSDMKVKHLCKLGLKAIDPEEEDEDNESKDLEEEENDELLEDNDEETADDDSEVIRKLLEEEEEEYVTSDEEFVCAVSTSKKKPRRSTRLTSSFGNNDSDRSSPAPEDDNKAPTRRSTRRAGPDPDDSGRGHRTRRRKRQSEDEPPVEDQEEESNPAGGDEGSEAACPEDQSTIVAKCYCETPSNIYASPDELTEPVFCQAIEIVDGVRVGCSHSARKEGGEYSAMVRAGPRAPFFLACTLHAKQLAGHMCCPACGLFCSQGIFYQCSEGHLFHLECGLPYSECKTKLGCPHCGVTSHRWQPANRECTKVKVEMKTSNKRIFLPDQREQCTPAYLSFTKLSPAQLESTPIIPAELLPPAKDRKLCAQPVETVKCTTQQLCDSILAGEGIEELLPKIVSGARLNKRIPSQEGGTFVHCAARCGNLAALYLLHNAGANLSLTDNNMRTPLMLAVLVLLDKTDAKKDKVSVKIEEMEVDNKEEPIDNQEDNSQDPVESTKTDEESGLKDEDLLKVIRYLLAAGVDVNVADQPDAMTPLHVAAQYGSATVCSILLAAGADVDARDQGGWSPLVWAAENSHQDAVRLLLSHGASATSTDNEGNSAAHWCALAGASACLQLLLQNDSKAAAASNTHADTPLHVAARQGHYACVVILLAHGARSDVENTAGELPMDVCTGQCQSAISLNMQMSMALKDNEPSYRVLTSDIANGREKYPIPCINEVDDAPAPNNFTYVTRHVTPYPIAIDNTIETLQGCKCEGRCGADGTECECVSLCVRGWWRGGRLQPAFPYHDPPMLFQCNQTCACNPKLCGNSVVSRLCEQGSMLVRAEVYRVGGTLGWGLRPTSVVKCGTPVATYCGELLPLQQADTRSDDSYMFALDVKQDLLEQCSEKELLCVDAHVYGSAARFINHSCAPNLAPLRLYTASRDLRLPTVTLVATRDVAQGEQFTFDYGDKFWSVKSKWMKCECGSAECRYPVLNTDETES